MEELFKSITDIVTSAIGQDWTSIGVAIVGTVQHGVELVGKLLGLG